MQASEIKWRRAGAGRQATVYAAPDRVFDLYQDRTSVALVQVCEFPVIGADGAARTDTYWLRGDDGLVRFLSDKTAMPFEVAESATEPMLLDAAE